MKTEITRTRKNGTKVYNPKNGIERIDAIREVVETRTYCKIDGIMLDLFTASMILKVYDNVNEKNQEKYRNSNVPFMATIAFKLFSKDK